MFQRFVECHHQGMRSIMQRETKMNEVFKYAYMVCASVEEGVTEKKATMQSL